MTAEVPRRRGAHERGASTLRLVWVYPDLLSTYGDRGNLLILQRRARLRGIEAEQVLVHADQPVPRQGDIYLLGGGEDLPQILAARRLRSDGGLRRGGRAGRGDLRRLRGLPADRHRVRRRGRPAGRRPGDPRHAQRPGGAPRCGGDPGRGEPGARPAPADRVREPSGRHPARARRGAAGQGADRRGQRRRHRGCLGGPGARHLPARPGACAQPGPGRPAAELGRRAAAPLAGREEHWTQSLRDQRLAAVTAAAP